MLHSQSMLCSGSGEQLITELTACIAVQLVPGWGAKGLDWRNRAEVFDMYGAWAKTEHDADKGKLLRGILDISDEEADKLASVTEQAEQPDAGSRDHAESFF